MLIGACKPMMWPTIFSHVLRPRCSPRPSRAGPRYHPPRPAPSCPALSSDTEHGQPRVVHAVSTLSPRCPRCQPAPPPSARTYTTRPSLSLSRGAASGDSDTGCRLATIQRFWLPPAPRTAAADRSDVPASIHPSIHPSIYPSIHPSIHPSPRLGHQPPPTFSPSRAQSTTR